VPFWTSTDVIELSHSIATDASRLALGPALGGADAVHLASALTLNATVPVLVTSDSSSFATETNVYKKCPLIGTTRR